LVPRLLTWRFLVVPALSVIWFASSPLVRAEDKVKVTVVAILANNRDDVIDQRLKCIAKEVQKVEPQLTGFQMGQITCKSLTVGKAAKVTLVESEAAEIVVQHGADQDDRVSLKVKAPQMGEIEYTSACGKFFPIVTRYQTKDKDRLIIAIMVRSCKNESKPNPSAKR
jgi:hypothetical protein